VYSVAGKIAEKAGVFFQHYNVNTSARQQKAEHHSGGTAADDAAFRGDRRIRH
jgi:hypothetical protein